MNENFPVVENSCLGFVARGGGYKQVPRGKRGNHGSPRLGGLLRMGLYGDLRGSRGRFWMVHGGGGRFGLDPSGHPRRLYRPFSGERGGGRENAEAKFVTTNVTVHDRWILLHLDHEIFARYR